MRSCQLANLTAKIGNPLLVRLMDLTHRLGQNHRREDEAAQRKKANRGLSSVCILLSVS